MVFGMHVRSITHRFARAGSGRARRPHDDGGYSVLVVVGFVLLLLSAILYTGFQIQNDTLNGQSLAATSARHDALTAVAVAGVQSIRYDPLIGSGETLNASPPSYCFGTTAPSSVTVDTFTVTAYCSTTMTTYPNATVDSDSPTGANEGTEYYCTSSAVLDTSTTPPTCVTTTTSATGTTTTTSAPAIPIGYTTRHVTLVACASTNGTSASASSCAANPELTVTLTFTDDQTDTAANTTDCAAVCGYAETIGAWKW